MENEKYRLGKISDAIGMLNVIPGQLKFLRQGYGEGNDAKAFAEIAFYCLPQIVDLLEEEIAEIQNALNGAEEPQET